MFAHCLISSITKECNQLRYCYEGSVRGSEFLKMLFGFPDSPTHKSARYAIVFFPYLFLLISPAPLALWGVIPLIELLLMYLSWDLVNPF